MNDTPTGGGRGPRRRRCLVTGATGFLGTNIVRELAEGGWEIRAMGLPGSETKFIKDLPVEIVFGDVADTSDVDSAVRGMDVVFNVAGDTSWWRRKFERQRKTNVEGPVNVAMACITHGVRRLVHTSTNDTLGYNPSGPADETWADYNYRGWGYNYADTKREGERKVLEFNGKGLEVVVVNPGSMLGPYDFTLQYGRLFFDLRDGKAPACPPGGVAFAHVRESARAHIAAAERGRPGEKYLCSGVNATYRDLFEAIAQKFGKHAPRLTMPRWLFVAYGYAMEFVSGFSGKPPEVDPGMARYMSVNAFYDSSKAVRDLGFNILPLQKMVDDAYDWYRKNGYL
jgi:dihydroflavonol-4-reductase